MKIRPQHYGIPVPVSPALPHTREEGSQDRVGRRRVFRAVRHNLVLGSQVLSGLSGIHQVLKEIDISAIRELINDR